MERINISIRDSHFELVSCSLEECTEHEHIIATESENDYIQNSAKIIIDYLR